LPLRFYTLPPRGVGHDYVFVNPRSFKELYKRSFLHAICDSGVHYFYANPSSRDYPNGYFERYCDLARGLVRSFGDKIWVTIPDYPDDYHPGQFGDNVQKTLANVSRFLGIKGIPWMPTIQANFNDVSSFQYCCEQLIGIDSFERVAIGTVCKIRNLRFISKCCQMAREYFPSAWIHAFGPSLNAIPHIRFYIDSFDSTAWTFPRKPNRSSCKTAIERRRYFKAYLSRLDQLDFGGKSTAEFCEPSRVPADDDPLDNLLLS